MQEIETHVQDILRLIGENPEREGLQKTPHRVAKMFAEVLVGYFQYPQKLINGAIYENEYESDNLVIIQNIEFKSLCEHHMLPFTGKAQIGYIPGKKIMGLSKIPRIVNMYARRLQVQERLTQQIVNCIDEAISPKGIIVLLDGHHQCASLRGVEQEQLNMRTIASHGVLDTAKYRSEFFNLISS